MTDSAPLEDTHTLFFNMDEDKLLFLYLPSNVTGQRYVSNTPPHFKIPLAKPLNFYDPHNWEVSLSELYFPSSYYNISKDNNSNLTIQYHIKGVVHTKNITIPQGHYDPASYMKEVNKEIKKIKHKFTATSEPKVLFKGGLNHLPCLANDIHLEPYGSINRIPSTIGGNVGRS